ncbi:E3 ubiquitin-protein ligase tom1, partial [Spiromyces aspiralis]
MGHPRSEAENALYHTSNDIANALRHLVTGTAGGTAPSSEGAAMDVDTATARPLPPLPSSSGTQVSDSSIKILDQAERDKVKDALHMLQRQFFDTIPTSFLRVMESTLDENVLVLSEFMNRVVTNPDYCDSILTELAKASGFLANNFVSLIRSIVASGDCQDAMTTSAGGSLSAGTVNMAPVERISKLVGTHAYFWAASLDRMDEFNDLVKYCKGDLLSSYCDVIACVGDVPASKSWVSPCIVFVNTMFEADRIMLEKGSIMSSEEQGKIRARFENAGVNGKDTAIEGDVSDAVQPTPTNAPDSEAKALLPELALKGLLDTALYLLRINAKEAPDADMILAALGLLLHLTHDHGLTAEFCEKKGLEALFGVARLLDVAKANENDGEQEKKAEGDSKLTQLSLVKSQYLSQSRQLFTLIIRHCLESMRFLQCHIESLIYDWFQNAHYHGAHVFDFIERNHGIIYRNFDIFKDVTRRRCILPRCDSGATSGPNLLIAWRSEDLLTLKEVVEYEHGGPNPLHEKKRKRAQQQGEGEWADSTAKEGTQEEDNKPDLLRSIGDADPSLSCDIVHFIIDELLSLRPPSAKTASSQPAAGDIGPQPSATADTTATTPLRSASFIRATCKQQQQQQLHHHHQYQQAAQESPDVIAYRCLLLQCLAELFVSFPHSLAGVLVQRGGDTLAQSSESEPCPVKVGSPLVNHLIHSIIPREAAISAFPSPNYRQKLGDDATEEEKRTAQLKDQIDEHRRALASAQLFWSTTVLTTMCLRYAEGLKKDKEETKAGSSDNSQRPSPPHPRLGFAVPNYETTLSQARQVILDHLALAMRETLALMSGTSHPLDVVYLRLGAWVGLAYKLLTTKPIGKSYTMTAYKRDYDRKEMARMMLERGLLDLMVVALSQLDLNHPRHRAVLKPLYGSFDELVKLSAEMSADVVMNKSAKASSDKAIASYFSNPTLLEPDSSDVGEYTGVSATQSSLPPDLYRNSALGISAGNASAVETDFNYSEMGDDYPDDDDYYNNDDSSLSDMSMTDISGESGDGEEEMAEDEYATEDEDDELDEQGEMEMYDQRYRADDQDNEMDVDDGDVTSESELDPDEQGIGSEDEVDIHGSDAMDEGVEDAEEELMLGDEGHDDEMYWETDHSDVEANEAEGSRHHRRHYPHGIGESGTEFRDGGSFLDILA